MSRFLAVSSAVLHKDCRELWPHAAPTAVLFAIDSASLASGALLEVTRPSAQLLVAMLIVRLLQSDSPASARHDWLTRPIPWLTLLAAKAAFMLLWLAVPVIVGGTAKGLSDGYSLGAALLEGARQSVPSPLLMVVIAASIITSSLWQAFLALGAAWLCQWALIYITHRVARPGVMDASDGPLIGTLWIQSSAVGLLVIVAGALILWQQYGRRKTGQARAIYAGALALAFLVVMVLLPDSRRFAVQQLLGSDSVAVDLVPGCFASRSAKNYAEVRELRNQVAPRAPSLTFLRRRVGANPVVFSTVLTERERAGADRLIFAHAEAKYIDAQGRLLFSVQGFAASPLLTTAADGRAATTHYWVLPREHYEALQARSDVRLQIDYSWSLLAPKARAVVPADGRREYYPGLGHCGAYPQGSSNYILVDCFKTGPQPALLYANAVGGMPSAGATSGPLDFKPAMLSLFFTGRHHQVSWTSGDAQPSQVQVTAYEARAHFASRVTAPGILGGPKETCPAPSASGS
jgi:hypothetical protein